MINNNLYQNLPPKYADNLLLGCCSWKYDSWKGLVYDTGKKYNPNDYLADYARHFKTVEIDQWFWSLFPAEIKLPDTETVRIYADSVPDDFTFSVKVPNAITLTNYYSRQPVKHKDFADKPNDCFLDIDLLNKFLDLISLMKEKLGPVIFQFEYLNKQKMKSQKQFMDKLSDFFANAPNGYEYAVEVRNPNYINSDYFDFLRSLGLSTVLVDGYYMPPVIELADKFDISSGKTTILRLQGPDRQEIEKLTSKKWCEIVRPLDDSVRSVADIIDRQVNKNRKVIVSVNNHYEGCAPMSIVKIIDQLAAISECGFNL